MFSLNSVRKIFVITVKGFKPATCIRNQDATTAPVRHIWETESLNWFQFMLQWFIRFPEFAEFTVFLLDLGTTPIKPYCWFGWANSFIRFKMILRWEFIFKKLDKLKILTDSDFPIKYRIRLSRTLIITHLIWCIVKSSQCWNCNSVNYLSQKREHNKPVISV